MANTSDSSLSIQQQYIPLFDGKNYDFWCVKMKTIFLSLDLWELVEKGYVEPDSSTTLTKAQQRQLKKQQQKNASALSKIQQGVSDSIFPIIMSVTTAKDAWDRLQQKYQENLEGQDQQKKGKEKKAGTTSNKGKGKIAGTRRKNEKDNIAGTEEEEIEEKDWIQYLPLYKAVDSGQWKDAKQILQGDSNKLTAIISGDGNIALHVAALAGHVKTVKGLVKRMEANDLALQSNKYKNTALHVASYGGFIDIAKILVSKNRDLLEAKGWISLPVVEASFDGDKNMVQYLYSMTKKEALDPNNRNTRKNGVSLLVGCINAEIYDIALELLSQFKSLADSEDTGGASALMALAKKASAFPSGSQLTFWQRWIYSRICVQPPHASTNIHGDIESPDEGSVHGDIESTHEGPTDRGKMITRGLKELLGCFGISSKLFATIPVIKHIYDEKLKHVQAYKLLVCVCERMLYHDPSQFGTNKVYKAIVEATRNGIVEFISEIIKTYPYIAWKFDDDGRRIFNYAILHRQEKIFNLLYGMGGKKKILAKKTDKDGNNMLHQVALTLHASSQLGRISGAALQMQRELQWFKEVENIVPQDYKENKNKEKKTPRALFTEEHKKLVEEGEKWMKDTAQSCTVVAALIATIMFAAAFTVPGGDNQDTGIPIYLHHNFFLIFIISDALSLFSSSISVLMFLAILTSRYREEDFLKSLPRKLIIGLSTLFFSILTMMTTFGTTLVILLRGRVLLWIPIPIIAVASIPVILFIRLQFRLLFEIFVSTCGRGIFERQPDRKAINPIFWDRICVISLPSPWEWWHKRE
uniref:PGG domain-containing protein n=1 Tax=Davidia involucrata TaxID=16924 RepID=A0A5B7BBL7_DAVIN